jgi:hypothetical protein
MNTRTILACVASMLLLAGITVWAQTRQDPTAITASPLVLSGADVGVRITGAAGPDGRVPGKLVVKINGRWIEVVVPMTVTDLGR